MPLELRTKVTKEGFLELSLTEVPMPEPADDEVVIRVEGAPINPSDLWLLLGLADVSTGKLTGTADLPVYTAKVPEKYLKGMTARLDKSLRAGNEGAGVVVSVGTSESAQALMSKTVSFVSGECYAQYRAVKVINCQEVPSGVTPAEAASSFVNPVTALGMVGTMRLEGHTALVHTAAASNLGQMLNKVCIKDGIDLVNIVRKDEQVEMLKSIGAKYVCNSSSPTFRAELIDALVATGATIAFDATGGGKLAGQILSCMEQALNRADAGSDPYGSVTHKQVYIYGGLDDSSTELDRNYGMAWGLGGWLLTQFLQKIGEEETLKLKARVAAEIKTIFASSYTAEVSLAEAISPDAISVYSKQATGEKYLINPNKDV